MEWPLASGWAWSGPASSGGKQTRASCQRLHLKGSAWKAPLQNKIKLYLITWKTHKIMTAHGYLYLKYSRSLLYLWQCNIVKFRVFAVGNLHQHRRHKRICWFNQNSIKTYQASNSGWQHDIALFIFCYFCSYIKVAQCGVWIWTLGVSPVTIRPCNIYKCKPSELWVLLEFTMLIKGSFWLIVRRKEQ